METDVNGTMTTTRPSDLEVWGISFAVVTVINLCAITGVLIKTFEKFKHYHMIMTFMVALAIGTLVGSSILILIPAAIEFDLSIHAPQRELYLWRISAVMGGIWLFFNVEHVLKLVIKLRKKRGSKSFDVEDWQMSTMTHHEPHNHVTHISFGNQILNTSDDRFPEAPSDTRGLLGEGAAGPDFVCQPNCAECEPCKVKDKLPELGSGPQTPAAPLSIEKPPLPLQPVEIAPVAWMIIFGDALHNFIDGLSIGASFSNSILAGLSVSVACFCEELPHELGDFAILLQAGMSMKQAVGYNLLSSFSCYVGLAIGILLGDLPSVAPWIYAIAGGMFLYIGLADMLPELGHTMESHDHLTAGHSHSGAIPFKNLAVQNSGLLVGFGLILLMSFYGEYLYLI